MIFLDSMTTKFVKTRLFFLIAKLALLACAIKKANLLKYIFFPPEFWPWENKNMPRKKLHQLLSGPWDTNTAHFAWDFGLGLSRTSSQAGGKEAKRHFKSQGENYEISVCLDLCMSGKWKKKETVS